LFSTLPGFLIFLARLFVPESPRYLLTLGRVKEAKEIIRSIAKINVQEIPSGDLIAPHPDHKLTILEQVKGMFGPGYLRYS
jgi:hypothetical protein